MGIGKRKKRSELPSRLKSSLMSLTLVLVFSLFGVGLFKVCTDKQANFEQKISELDAKRAERRALSVHNERMRERVQFLKTRAGVEEIAREKLGLVKPGEFAYSVVPPPPARFVEADEATSARLAAQVRNTKPDDHGLVVKILRHLFGERDEAEQVST